jgi:hypothetical protein
MSKWLCCLILSILFFFCLSLNDTNADEEGQGYIASDKFFDFAETLFETEDYFRAIGEYKRFAFYYPQDMRVEKSVIRIGECYFKAGRWLEAIAALNEFTSKYPKSTLRYDALYFKGLAQKNIKHFDEALFSFDEIVKEKESPPRMIDIALFQSALVHVDEQNWHAGIKYFSQIPKDSEFWPSANTFVSGLERIETIPHKSPCIAGTMAALLPGAGHLYTERLVDALTAFLLNATFIWAAVELFDHGNYAAGGIVTFFELGWYSGNIYSAVSSAHKYNKQRKENFIRHLKESASISFMRELDRQSNIVMFNFRY